MIPFVSRPLATLVAAPTAPPPVDDGPLRIGPPRPPAPVHGVPTKMMFGLGGVSVKGYVRSFPV